MALRVVLIALVLMGLAYGLFWWSGPETLPTVSAGQAARPALERLTKQTEGLSVRETDEGIVLELSDILFDFDQARVRRDTARGLEGFAEVAREVQARLRIEGHTDAIGTTAYNQRLSERRARAVRDFLVERGVDPDAITESGFGAARPAASNDTREGRSRNRRVEITILDAAAEGPRP